MAQDVSNILTINMEQVRKELPALYEMNSTAYGMLSSDAEKFRISKTPNSTDFRVPLDLQPPSSFGTFSLSGGSLGTGNSFTTNQFYQTYFPLILSVDINVSSIVATGGGPNLSIVNAWKHSMKKAMPSFQRFADASFHNQGGADGVVAISTAISAITGSGATATATVTCDTAFGSNLVQVGQPLEITDSAAGTWRTSAVSPDSLPYVSAVDKVAGRFTITNLGSVTPSATDLYYFKSAVAAGPTVAWLNGLNYFHSSAASGNILGLDRTLYDIKPNLVNASGALVPAHIWQGMAQARQRRGDIPTKYKGLIHDAQLAAIKNLGLSISEILVPQGTAFKPTDVAGGMQNSVPFGGVELTVDVHQSKTRIDVLLPSDNWCRVYGQEVDFWKSPEGKMVFEGRNSSGVPTAKFSFYVWCAENFVCVDPAREILVYGLSIPNGF
jgi:hypothetical protein